MLASSRLKQQRSTYAWVDIWNCLYHARFSSETTGELISSGEACDCGSDERNIWVLHSVQKASRQDWGLSNGSDPRYEERPRPTVYTRQDARYESPGPRYNSPRHWEPPLDGQHQHTNLFDASRVQLPIVVKGSASVVIVRYKERLRLIITDTQRTNVLKSADVESSNPTIMVVNFCIQLLDAGPPTILSEIW